MLFESVFAALSLLAPALVGLATAAKQAVAEKNEKAMEAHKKMMEAHKKIGTPGAKHEFFKNFVGDWKVTTKTWMDPNEEPMVSEGTSSGQILYGGRYLELTYRGQMMGEVFEGKQIVAYDNREQKYVGLWIDSASTAFQLTEGELDKAGKTLIEHAAWLDPMGKKMKVRDQIRVISPTEFTFEMYVAKKGSKEFKTLENHYYKA